MSNKILIAGDPHGRFNQIVEAVRRLGSTDVVLLGDIEAEKNLDLIFPKELNVNIHYIRGNHEHEDMDKWMNVINSRYGANDITGKVIEIDGIRIAGISGVFQKEIWYPPNGSQFESMEDWESRSRHDKWFEQKRLKHSAGTIFPDEYFRIAELKADVLVSHEAPDCHPYGFSAINDLANFMEAKYVFHGHHHDNLDYSHEFERMGFDAHGVGLAGIKNIIGQEITPGLFDQERLEIRARKMVNG